MDRPGWPVVVRLQHIENAAAADAGAFASRSVAPFAVPPIASRWLATFCVNTAAPEIALTFDDGPHPEHTPRLLDLLAARGATATFFVLSPQVEAHPDLARRILADGHEIALHGADHRSLLTMSTGGALSAVRRAKDVVEAVVGTRIRLYRPPYGEYTPAQAVRLRLAGLETIIWSGDSRDWQTDDEEAIVAQTVSSSFPGGIILLHDNRGDPESFAADGAAGDYDRAQVVAAVLDRLEPLGYRTRTVGALLAAHQRVRSIARYGSDGVHLMGAS